MKNKTTTLSILFGGVLCASFSTTAFANHRAGDFPLPELITSGDFNKDGKVDLGDGEGEFNFVNRLNGDGDPTRVLLTDLNHDGFLDILANAPTEGKVLIYFGN